MGGPTSGPHGRSGLVRVVCTGWLIAQGNPTFIDELVAVATHGQAVRCGCADGTHHLIASQDQLQADMEATIDIPKDMAEKARKRAKHMTRARRESHEPLA